MRLELRTVSTDMAGIYRDGKSVVVERRMLCMSVGWRTIPCQATTEACSCTCTNFLLWSRAGECGQQKPPDVPCRVMQRC